MLSETFTTQEISEPAENRHPDEPGFRYVFNDSDLYGTEYSCDAVGKEMDIYLFTVAFHETPLWREEFSRMRKFALCHDTVKRAFVFSHNTYVEFHDWATEDDDPTIHLIESWTYLRAILGY